MVVATARNPNPQVLPTLSAVNDRDFVPGKTVTFLRAVFPNLPSCIIDAWCYESPATFFGARPIDGGGLELRHRFDHQPQVLWLTRVLPSPGAVEFVVGRALDPNFPNDGKLPPSHGTPNLCCQFRHAPLFASAPESYPRFVARCFLFTAAGPVALSRTERRKIPNYPTDHPYNHPPHVQMYAAAGTEPPPVGPQSWADYSPDRYVTPVIGVVSRDGQYLAALGCEGATTMAQAWHDCLHDNPPWLPADAPPAEQRWRVKLYVMGNDPKLLLSRVFADFPGARVRPQRPR